MKAELVEHDGVFELVLTPEHLEDGCKLVRLGMNARAELNGGLLHLEVSVDPKNGMEAYMQICALNRKKRRIKGA